MKYILSFFDFESQQIGLLFGRFGIEVLLTLLTAFLVAVILLAFTKKKHHEIGFSNWFKVCFMYGLNAAIATLGVVAILIIRSNGLYYFYKAAFSLSWQCGYLLMIPEIVLAAGLFAAYWLINRSIKDSIK